MTDWEYYKNLKQGSHDWFLARRGRFTGSMVHKLVCPRSCKAKKVESRLSKTAQSYVRKVVGQLTVADEDVATSHTTSYAMERGKELEPIARDIFSMRHMVKVEHWGFRPFCDWGGVSTDGIGLDITGDRGVVEIKCRNLETHLNYCRVKDWAGLLQVDPQAFWQLQYGMLVHPGIDHSWFVAYSDRPGGKNKHLRLHAIKLKRNPEHTAMLGLYLWNACRYRELLINDLKIKQ